MSDIINLLPEAIANQIAAGEVIQRPSSVVKELMENAIDAEATQITLIVKNYGKSLIQVIDNGFGMTETDARMCFERHATSKIREAKDLYSIKTMGFRGEALASIASIAEVELKTRKGDTDIANLIVVRSSEIIEQTYCQAETGTSIAVKNLFFNVPARRKFLKTDSVELKYITEEFKRIALSYPKIKFKFIHNDNEIYNLLSGTTKKRILGLFRKTYEQKLLRVEEDTDVIKIKGLIGNPEIARKQKGEQFIFVNNRYVKSHYLDHAIKGAFDTLIGEDQFPFYVMFLEIDPASIDINVHPTKQEIKFDDERLIYNYLKVSIKHALGRYSLSPRLDFENENGEIRSPHVNKPNNGPFSNTLASRTRSAPVMRQWQSLYSGSEGVQLNEELERDQEDAKRTGKEFTLPSAASGDLKVESLPFDSDEKDPYQIHNSYIIVPIRNGFFILDQYLAHQRILFEKYLISLNARQELMQKQLFPISLQISKDKVELFGELIIQMKNLGFDIQPFGGETFVVHGIPAGFKDNNLQDLVDRLLEEYSSNLDLGISKNENLARSMAQSAAIKKGQNLDVEEMRTLVNELFACQNPFTSPIGKKCFVNFDLADLEKQFR